MPDADELFKVLGPDREATHGGRGVWPVPGEWLRVTGDLVPCWNGLHLCRHRDLPLWVREGAWVWRVEVNNRFKRVVQYDKVVVREARLTEPVGVLTPRVLRLFAADCAERVAHLHGHHPVCMTAIRVARLFAHGVATAEDLNAARDAAGEAAWAAREAAGAAAGDAAGAAGDAAWAAWGAAWGAARDAQGVQLINTLARHWAVAG